MISFPLSFPFSLFLFLFLFLSFFFCFIFYFIYFPSQKVSTLSFHRLTIDHRLSTIDNRLATSDLPDRTGQDVAKGVSCKLFEYPRIVRTSVTAFKSSQPFTRYTYPSSAKSLQFNAHFQQLQAFTVPCAGRESTLANSAK